MQIIYIIAIAAIIFGVIGMIRHKKNNPSEEGKNIDSTTIIISFLIPLVGFIIYGVNSDSNPTKAKGALNAALWGIGVGVVAYFLMRA